MREPYAERQAKCGLKVGDKVKVLRKADDFEGGWRFAWVIRMDENVGKTGVIEEVGEAIGFGVKFDKEEYQGYYYPYFVLEKVEDEPEVEKSYAERQAECGLKVGDKVKVLRKADNVEGGWNNIWVIDMDEVIGEIGVITEDGDVDGFKVRFYGLKTGYHYPYFVLEKVEDELTSSYEIYLLPSDRDRPFLVENVVKEENTEDSRIFEKENGEIWEFYKEHIVAIKQY